MTVFEALNTLTEDGSIEVALTLDQATGNDRDELLQQVLSAAAALVAAVALHRGDHPAEIADKMAQAARMTPGYEIALAAFKLLSQRRQQQALDGIEIDDDEINSFFFGNS